MSNVEDVTIAIACLCGIFFVLGFLVGRWRGRAEVTRDCTVMMARLRAVMRGEG